MLNEETVPGNGRRFRDCPIKSFTRDHVITLRDRKVKEVDKKTGKMSPKPNAANHRVTQLRVILSWGMDERAAFVTKNVAETVKLVSVKTDGYHTWTEDEVARYEEWRLIGAMARLALDLMLYTGMRRSDAMRVGPADIVQIKNPETGSPETWLAFTPKKTSGTTGKGLKLPLLDVLRESIAATPHGLQTLLVTGYGKPFSSSNSFGNWFKDRGAEAALPLFCTAHGLRKAGAVEVRREQRDRQADDGDLRLGLDPRWPSTTSKWPSRRSSPARECTRSRTRVEQRGNISVQQV